MTESSNPQSAIQVCAAVVYHQDKILITLRPSDKKLGGFWEFPGGKIEDNESPQTALIREIREELDIEVAIEELLVTVPYSYAWGRVVISAYRCRWESGDIKHLEVADHCWVAAEDLTTYNILAADQPIIKKIQEHQL